MGAPVTIAFPELVVVIIVTLTTVLGIAVVVVVIVRVAHSFALQVRMQDRQRSWKRMCHFPTTIIATKLLHTYIHT